MPRTRRPAAPALPTTFATPSGALAAARAGTGGAATVPTPRPRRRAAAPTPLGSLLTTPAPVLARDGCLVCGDTAVTRLRLTVAGAPVTFVSCSACEARCWSDADGAPLPLDEVLAGSPRV